MNKVLGNSGKNNDITEKQDVVVNSKIGSVIVGNLRIPNIYSEYLIEELEKKGISDKYKRLFAFCKITSDTNYENIIRISENYIGNYITSKDLENVVYEYFGNDSNVTHGEILGDDSYDSTNKNYVLIPMGFGGNDLDYVVEVPYKITELNGVYEVYVYRIYITKKSISEIEENSPADYVYYDSNRKEEALKISDDRMYDEDIQTQILESKIKSKEIDVNKLKKVKYEFKVEGTKKIITGYEIVK